MECLLGAVRPPLGHFVGSSQWTGLLQGLAFEEQARLSDEPLQGTIALFSSSKAASTLSSLSSSNCVSGGAQDRLAIGYSSLRASVGAVI